MDAVMTEGQTVTLVLPVPRALMRPAVRSSAVATGAAGALAAALRVRGVLLVSLIILIILLSTAPAGAILVLGLRIPLAAPTAFRSVIVIVLVIFAALVIIVATIPSFATWLPLSRMHPLLVVGLFLFGFL